MAKPTDIKGKIRHLLALAESPNENEARAALLKARELLARPVDLRPLCRHWRELLLQGVQNPHKGPPDADHRIYRP